MQRETFELLHDQVRAIYRAITGGDVPESSRPPPLPAGVDAVELLIHRFAELEGCTRLVPGVAERVPPFAFAPPVDVIEHDGELLVELAIPSVQREELAVELTDRMLVVSGQRAGEKAANGRVYRHAEIPRGPFRRVVLLPPDLAVAGATPRIDLENGIVRIRIGKPQRGAVPSA